MRRHAQSLIVAVLPLVLTSCVYSLQPLSDESTSTLDHRLIGTWAALEEDGQLSHTNTMTIGRKSGTKNTLEAVGLVLNCDNTDKVKRITWYAKTVKINYLSMELDKELVIVEDTKEEEKAY